MDATARTAGRAAADIWQERIARGEGITEALAGLIADIGLASEEVGALAFFAGLILDERGREAGR